MSCPSCTCGACFEAEARVVEIHFSEESRAFGHYVELARQGHFPALCQKSGGAYHVCHRQIHLGTAGK